LDSIRPASLRAAAAPLCGDYFFFEARRAGPMRRIPGKSCDPPRWLAPRQDGSLMQIKA
jgi:hypothetical protein